MLVSARSHAAPILAALAARQIAVAGVDLVSLARLGIVRDLTALTQALDHLADGTVVKSYIKAPNSLSMLELFHITAGKIDRIEVVHIDVPYGMPSVWRRDDD